MGARTPVDSWPFRSPPAVPARLANFPASVLSSVKWVLDGITSRLSMCSYRPPSKTLCKWRKGFSKRGQERSPPEEIPGVLDEAVGTGANWVPSPGPWALAIWEHQPVRGLRPSASWRVVLAFSPHARCSTQDAIRGPPLLPPPSPLPPVVPAGS